uniref:Putative LOC102309779 [Haplochromis burtoni] n=1 Tax=Lepeophtheirus salmonis TaxID=72036 RepID=A0A0K2T645_LEPSM
MNTAAYSRFSNVLCERKNGILGIIVSRLVEEDITDGDVALDWTVAARNYLQNFGVFPPDQLFFGFNTNYSSLDANMLPAREPTTQSETVRRNLNALHSARCEYMKNESNVKIQRALLHNIGDGAMKDLNVGDIVFYKRNDDSKWKCPGKIIGKDSKVYLVRHCVNCIRCHVCMLQKDVRMRKSVVKEGVPMVKTNVEARVNYIDHGYGQIQINVEEARDDDDVHNIYGRRQINVMKARIEDENGITSHVEDEDVSNSNEENVSRKHGECTG